VPPLRDRREDIPHLVRAFVHELTSTVGKVITHIDPDDVAALATYAWPGNVRELRNIVERAMIMAAGPMLRISVPQADAGLNAPAGEDGRETILQALQDTAWRIRGPQGAAARLGLKPTTLESRIRKLGLVRPGSRTARQP
jgi:transcriptional regulator with GAF, ATPase, and Fis domain